MGLPALIALSAASAGEQARQGQRAKSKARGVQEQQEQQLAIQQEEAAKLAQGQEIEAADPLRAFKRRVSRKNLRIEAGPPQSGVAGVGAGAGLRI